MSEQPRWRDSRAKRIQVAAIAAVGYPLIATLGRTLRWVVDGLDHLDEVTAAGRQPILALWHGRILPGTCFLRHRGIVVMTSENFDGEWIARIITRFGFGTARGSTSRGSRRALLQLTRDLRRGRPVAFTVDGPRGPARRAQPGAVWLARATGHPVVPFHVEAARCWTLPSWDAAQIPQPFSRVAFVVGAPLYVARGGGDEAVEAARRRLEEALEELTVRALRLVGRL